MSKYGEFQNATQSTYAMHVQSLRVCPFDMRNWWQFTSPSDRLYIGEERGGWLVKRARQPYAGAAENFVAFPSKHTTDPRELSKKGWWGFQRALQHCIGDGPAPTLSMRFSMEGSHRLTGATIKHLHAHIFIPKPDVTFHVGIGTNAMRTAASPGTVGEECCPVLESRTDRLQRLGRSAGSLALYHRIDGLYSHASLHLASDEGQLDEVHFPSLFKSLLTEAGDRETPNGVILVPMRRDEAGKLYMHAHLLSAPPEGESMQHYPIAALPNRQIIVPQCARLIP